LSKRREWFRYIRHPQYPVHGQLALLAGRNGTYRRVAAIFNENLNPLRPRDAAPYSNAVFTLELYFPSVYGGGQGHIVKSASEEQAKAELERRFLDFIEDVVQHE
jgi:hypothetical protein